MKIIIELIENNKTYLHEEYTVPSSKETIVSRIIDAMHRDYAMWKVDGNLWSAYNSLCDSTKDFIYPCGPFGSISII